MLIQVSAALEKEQSLLASHSDLRQAGFASGDIPLRFIYYNENSKENNEEKVAKTMKTINELCDAVRETAYAIHVSHGHGHFEKVYENALAHRLRKMGLNVQQQPPIQVLDEDGTVIGDYNADLLIEHRLIIELKAARALADEHVAQLLGYLKSTRLEHGLLMNFGSYKFQIKKYIRTNQAAGAPAFGFGALLASIFAFFAFLRDSPGSWM